MFAVLQAARELKLQEQAGIMVELVDIAMVPNQPIDYMKSLKRSYQKMSDFAVQDQAAASAPSAPEGREPIQWADASALMWSAMKTMKRLNRG